MFRLIWIASVHICYFLRRYMPSNIVLDAIRTRRGLKWGVPAMLLAVPYLYAASVVTVLITDGAAGWLHLVTLALVWSAMKFIIMGPVSLLRLVRMKAAEARGRRAARRAVVAIGHPV